MEDEAPAEAFREEEEDAAAPPILELGTILKRANDPVGGMINVINAISGGSNEPVH